MSSYLYGVAADEHAVISQGRNRNGLQSRAAEIVVVQVPVCLPIDHALHGAPRHKGPARVEFRWVKKRLFPRGPSVPKQRRVKASERCRE